MLYVDNNNINIPFNTHFAIQFDIINPINYYFMQTNTVASYR